MLMNTAGGSVRDPAVVHGVQGFRPSHDGTAEPNTSMPCLSVIETRALWHVLNLFYRVFQRSGYLTRDMKTLFDLTFHGLRLPCTGPEVC